MTASKFDQAEALNKRAEDEQPYEARDVDARTLLKVGLLFVVALFAVTAAAWGLQIILTGKLPSLQPPDGGLAVLPDVTPPPEPRLQADPAQDLQAVRARENQLLQSYGWIDQTAGIVRLPIDRAMDLLVARGLPTRPLTETQSFSDEDQALPSASNSGRQLEQIRP